MINLKKDNSHNDVLGYNQKISIDLLENINLSNEDMDDLIFSSKELLKEFNIENIKSTFPLESELDTTIDKKINLNLEKTWDELVSEANENGFKDTKIEDILTKEEILESKNRIKRIEAEFKKITKLDELDMKFLFFAIALQCLRQYIFSNEKFRFENASDGDKALKKIIPKNYHEILLQSVPYDAVEKIPEFKDLDTGISGANHRYTTLGHDPLYGWIFGTLNIMTTTLTKNDLILSSYKVEKHPSTGNPIYIGKPIWIGEVFKTSYDYISQDYKILGISVLKQALHLGADAFTKMGLPIPILNRVSPNLSQKLMGKKFRIDSYSVGRGIILSSIINALISEIHSLFYNENEHGTQDLFEVKTRKILLLSNTISSTSNILYTSITKDFTKLDVGGILVSIYRLINDLSFINRIKDEFVNSKLDEDFKIELDFINNLLASL